MARTSNKSAEIKEQTKDAEVETKAEVVEDAKPDAVETTPTTEETKKVNKTEEIKETKEAEDSDTSSTDVQDNTIIHEAAKDDAEDKAIEEPANDDIIVDEGPIIADNEVRIQVAPVNIVYPINAYAGPSESMLVGTVAGWMNVEIDTTSEFVHFEKAQGAGVVCGYIRRSDIR